MKLDKIFKQGIIVLCFTGILNSCKKEPISNDVSNSIESSKAKLSDLLTGGNSSSVAKMNLAYRIFPNIDLAAGGGSGGANRSFNPESNNICTPPPGYTTELYLRSVSVGYNCSGALEANFIVSLVMFGTPPGGLVFYINGFGFNGQPLPYNNSLGCIGDDCYSYLVEHVPYNMIIGNPCMANNVNINVNSVMSPCGSGTLSDIVYSMPATGTNINGSWQPSTISTSVPGQAKLWVPIVACYTNPCDPSQPPFTNYTFRYKLQNTTTWTEVTATYFQTQIGYIINNLPAGTYNLEGRDSASNPWVTGSFGGVFTVL